MSSGLRAGGPASITASVSQSHFTFRLEKVRALRERAEDQANVRIAWSLQHRLDGATLLRAPPQHRLESPTLLQRPPEHRDRARAEARSVPDLGRSGTDLIELAGYLDELVR